MSGSFIYRHHVEPRVKLYSPREESFPIPLKYIDVSRTTHTNLDVKQEKRIDDCWNIAGSRDLSDSGTGFHTIYGRKTSRRIYKPKVPNQVNQIQTQIMIERGNPLFAATQVTRKVPPKHVLLMKARTSMLKMKQIMIERGNPLFAVMQITSNLCYTWLTSTSEYPDCHILLWNKLRTIVFGSSWRRSKTTLTDHLFNEIYN